MPRNAWGLGGQKNMATSFPPTDCETYGNSEYMFAWSTSSDQAIIHLN
jgi:hypothetical protein